MHTGPNKSLLFTVLGTHLFVSLGYSKLIKCHQDSISLWQQIKS